MNTQTIETMTPEDIGQRLAFFLRWDGKDITTAFLSALTDANYHALRKELEPIINQHLKD